MQSPSNCALKPNDLIDVLKSRWTGEVTVIADTPKQLVLIECGPGELQEVCGLLVSHAKYAFATLVVQEDSSHWLLRYIFYGDLGCGQVHVIVRQPKAEEVIPSISEVVHAADWHEREVEDLFGLTFEGHPKLGDFVLHEEWPDGVNPMRSDFDASKPFSHREIDPEWRPMKIVQARGAFMMPIGPIYSDYAESAQFFLETVGEDVIRTTQRFFYKYRGLEKLAEGQPIEQVLLMAERFSGTSAFAHSLAFCQAVEQICGVQPPSRSLALRVLFAELERLRHRAGVIAGICSSTALAVAASQASILEEDLLRLSCMISGHRYLFGLNIPGGLSVDLTSDKCLHLSESVKQVVERLNDLQEMLRFSSSFLDRIEEVGIVTGQNAVSYGLVGPIARASGVSRDLRKVLPYGFYNTDLEFKVPVEFEGDGYARLRVLFSEAEESARIIRQVASSAPSGEIIASDFEIVSGEALGWTEAPAGAAFHWLNIRDDGRLGRYRVTPPSFTNWHGFHWAAENFAFQDFPIIMATFGLSNAECDR
jgi:formate hydrogenlyase subunit 5